MTCDNFLLNPVEQHMLINENRKLGIINSPPSNNSNRIMASESSKVPSGSLILLSDLLSVPHKKKTAMNTPFVTIDVVTAKNARKNLHLQTPLRAPSLVNNAKGPT